MTDNILWSGTHMRDVLRKRGWLPLEVDSIIASYIENIDLTLRFLSRRLVPNNYTAHTRFAQRCRPKRESPSWAPEVFSSPWLNWLTKLFTYQAETSTIIISFASSVSILTDC